VFTDCSWWAPKGATGPGRDIIPRQFFLHSVVLP
jgi:hypothetical protein